MDVQEWAFLPVVMAGLVPAIHDFKKAVQVVDARRKVGHDAVNSQMGGRQ